MSWPRVGGGVRIEAGVALSWNGSPTWRIAPYAGCSCSTVMPSATASGEANAATTSLIGPHGISAASSAVHPVGRRAGRRRPSARIGRSADRFSTRSPLVAKRGSSARPGSPSAAHNRGHCRSDPTATAIAPSAVSNVSYGTMFGWALPSRPGALPDTNAFCAWLTRLASVAPRIETSTRWPAPAPGPASRSRPTSAPSNPTAPEQPGQDVADRHADLGRAAAVGVGGAGDRHQPADGLDDEVVAGPVGRRAARSVARDREVDEPRVERPQRLVVEPEPGEAIAPEVLDQDVRVGQQPAQDRRAVGALEVEAEAALVAVDREEIGGGPRPGLDRADPRRTPAAGRIALRWLDLDHLGAEVAEQHRAVRPGQDRRAVDDAESGERAGGLVGSVGHRRPMVAPGRRGSSAGPRRRATARRDHVGRYGRRAASSLGRSGRRWVGCPDGRLTTVSRITAWKYRVR